MKKLLAFVLLACMFVCAGGFASTPSNHTISIQHIKLNNLANSNYYFGKNIEVVGKTGKLGRVEIVSNVEFRAYMDYFDRHTGGSDTYNVDFDICQSGGKCVHGVRKVSVKFTKEGFIQPNTMVYSIGQGDEVHKLYKFKYSAEKNKKYTDQVDVKINVQK